VFLRHLSPTPAAPARYLPKRPKRAKESRKGAQDPSISQEIPKPLTEPPRTSQDPLKSFISSYSVSLTRGEVKGGWGETPGPLGRLTRRLGKQTFPHLKTFRAGAFNPGVGQRSEPPRLPHPGLPLFVLCAGHPLPEGRLIPEGVLSLPREGFRTLASVLSSCAAIRDPGDPPEGPFALRLRVSRSYLRDTNAKQDKG
jgi:hypothetical protein